MATRTTGAGTVTLKVSDEFVSITNLMYNFFIP